MSWREKMKEYGGGDLSFLSEDGEVLCFAVVGDPILLEGKFKGTPTEKIGCPVVTEDGFVLFIAGKRLARKIAKYEAVFGDTAFMAIRHGEQNDVNSTYELKTIDDDDFTQRIFSQVEGKDFTGDIAEAVEGAKEVMKQ